MRLNPLVSRVATSPITEAYSWVEGRDVSGTTTGPTTRPGRPFLDVSQAVPGYPPAQELRDHVAALARRDDVHGYTEQLGVAPLREAVARHTRTLYSVAGSEVEVTAGQVGISAGCNQAFCLAIAALAGPGDEVILPLPFYFNHDMWLRSQGVRPVYLPCDGRQLPRLDLLADLLTPSTRALVLISPNNPTGAIYPTELLADAFDRCAAADIALVLDETYRDFAAGPTEGETRPHSLFERPNWPEVLIQLFSFSKVYCLPGYRVGSMVASAEVLEQTAKAMDCLAICPPRLGQEAVLFGLRELDGWVADKRRQMAERLQCFLDAMAEREVEASGWRVSSAGAYFAYLTHPFDHRTARDVARRLAQEYDVLTLCGEMFGPGQEEALRLAFANLPMERIPELVRRLVRATT